MNRLTRNRVSSSPSKTMWAKSTPPSSSRMPRCRGVSSGIHQPLHVGRGERRKLHLPQDAGQPHRGRKTDLEVQVRPLVFHHHPEQLVRLGLVGDGIQRSFHSGRHGLNSSGRKCGRKEGDSRLRAESRAVGNVLRSGPGILTPAGRDRGNLVRRRVGPPACDDEPHRHAVPRQVFLGGRDRVLAIVEDAGGQSRRWPRPRPARPAGARDCRLRPKRPPEPARPRPPRRSSPGRSRFSCRRRPCWSGRSHRHPIARPRVPRPRPPARSALGRR